jgi:hypothetical protein
MDFERQEARKYQNHPTRISKPSQSCFFKSYLKKLYKASVYIIISRLMGEFHKAKMQESYEEGIGVFKPDNELP